MVSPESGPGLLERDPREAFIHLVDSTDGVDNADFDITRVDKDRGSFIVSGTTIGQCDEPTVKAALEALFKNTPGVPLHGPSGDGRDHFKIAITKEDFEKALAA